MEELRYIIATRENETAEWLYSQGFEIAKEYHHAETGTIVSPYLTPKREDAKLYEDYNEVLKAVKFLNGHYLTQATLIDKVWVKG